LLVLLLASPGLTGRRQLTRQQGQEQEQRRLQHQQHQHHHHRQRQHQHHHHHHQLRFVALQNLQW